MAQNIHFGLVLHDELTKKDWESFGRLSLRPVVEHLENHDKKIAETQGDLKEVRSKLAWATGDWLHLGIKVSGTKPGRLRKDVKKYLGWERSPGTLSNYMTVCKAIPFSRRREGLPFSHHLVIAKFDEKNQEWLLDMATGYRRDEHGNKVLIDKPGHRTRSVTQAPPEPISFRHLKAIIAHEQEIGSLASTGGSEPSLRELKIPISHTAFAKFQDIGEQKLKTRNVATIVGWMAVQFRREHNEDWADILAREFVQSPASKIPDPKSLTAEPAPQPDIR